MTSEHEQHLELIKAEAAKLIDAKYRKGAAEYGTKLWKYTPRRILDEAIHEAVDQVIYLLTMRDEHFPREECPCRGCKTGMGCWRKK